MQRPSDPGNAQLWQGMLQLSAQQTPSMQLPEAQPLPSAQAAPSDSSAASIAPGPGGVSPAGGLTAASGPGGCSGSRTAPSGLPVPPAGGGGYIGAGRPDGSGSLRTAGCSWRELLGPQASALRASTAGKTRPATISC